MLAIADADFPRVLNGPAPGYAEDALRRLAFGTLPAESADALVGAGRSRNRRGALKRSPTIHRATEEAGHRVEWRTAGDGGGANGVPRVEPVPFERVPGLEGFVGAALSEGFSWENKEEERWWENKEEEQQVT